MEALTKNITQSRTLLTTTVQDFFAHSHALLLRIAIWYAVVLIVLIMLHQQSKKSFERMNTIFEKSMDDLYYQTSLILYKEWDNLHDRANTIPLLFKHKTDEFTRGSQANYYEHFDKLLEELIYIAELTDQELSYDEEKLRTHQELTNKLFLSYSRIKSSLITRSAGLAKHIL